MTHFFKYYCTSIIDQSINQILQFRNNVKLNHDHFFKYYCTSIIDQSINQILQFRKEVNLKQEAFLQILLYFHYRSINLILQVGTEVNLNQETVLKFYYTTIIDQSFNQSIKFFNLETI
jgi:hypothetical protein